MTTMLYRSDFPYPVRTIASTTIVLLDGCRLRARVWLPEDAEENPVPAILEYLPYRKNDATAGRDAQIHPYFAGHGFPNARSLRGGIDAWSREVDTGIPRYRLDKV